MNIRYTILALLVGSQLSLAVEPNAVESSGHEAPLTGSQIERLPAITPTLDISEALAEKLDRQLKESTAKQPLPKAQWVSAAESASR